MLHEFYDQSKRNGRKLADSPHRLVVKEYLVYWNHYSSPRRGLTEIWYFHTGRMQTEKYKSFHFPAVYAMVTAPGPQAASFPDNPLYNAPGGEDQPQSNFLQQSDLFGIIFASPAIFGSQAEIFDFSACCTSTSG